MGNTNTWGPDGHAQLRGDIYVALSIAIRTLHALRDEFAKAALQGLLARDGAISVREDAEFSYMATDAMLEAKFK